LVVLEWRGGLFSFFFSFFFSPLFSVAASSLSFHSTQLTGRPLSYVALFPCNECAKLIIQSGIRHVVYMADKYRDDVSFIASRRMLTLAGVTLRLAFILEVFHYLSSMRCPYWGFAGSLSQQTGGS
jgi:hypothetical protein